MRVMRAHDGVDREHDQVTETERVLVSIAERGVELELKSEARAAVAQLALDQVVVVEAVDVGRRAGEVGVGVERVRDEGRELGAVLLPLVCGRVASRPDADHVAAIRERVVDRLLALRSAEVDHAATRLEHRVELLDALQQLVAERLRAELFGTSMSSATMVFAREPAICPLMPTDFTEGAGRASQGQRRRPPSSCADRRGDGGAEGFHLVDEPQGEGRECVSALLRRRHHQHLVLGVARREATARRPR
jgi:hypothetical protein